MKTLLVTLAATVALTAHAADEADASSQGPAPAAVTKTARATTKTAAKATEPKSGMLKFNYKNADINRVIEDYARASGQKFIIDGKVAGRISIYNPAPVTIEEAFNQLSTALASNQIAISTRADQMYVSHARMIQRDLIPVVTEVPSVNPERMVTLVINLKHISADELNKQLRILTSRDGELVPYTPNNQILVSDWTPNLVRISEIVKQIDVPADNPGQASPPPPSIAEPSEGAAESGPKVTTLPAPKKKSSK